MYRPETSPLKLVKRRVFWGTASASTKESSKYGGPPWRIRWRVRSKRADQSPANPGVAQRTRANKKRAATFNMVAQTETAPRSGSGCLAENSRADLAQAATGKKRGPLRRSGTAPKWVYRFTLRRTLEEDCTPFTCATTGRSPSGTEAGTCTAICYSPGLPGEIAAPTTVAAMLPMATF